MSADLVSRLASHIEADHLFPHPGLALLAISGGPDSLALLDLMSLIAGQHSLSLAVAHVDHGIQPGSADVARAVMRLAERYHLAGHTETFSMGPDTSETEARRQRYRALRQMQEKTGADYLVTAHHADDQVETVLFRLLRGSGMAGLAGIRARGPDGLIRPLLAFRRSELAEWLEARGLTKDAHHDPANVDRRHDRSWIRHDVLPALRARIGGVIDERLLDSAFDAARNRDAWAVLLRTLPELDFDEAEGGVEVARGAIATYDKVLSEAVLRAVLREVGYALGARRVQAVRRFVLRGRSGAHLELGRGWRLELAFDRLRVCRAPLPAGAETQWEGPAGQLRFGAWSVRWQVEPAGSVSRSSLTTWVSAERGVVRGARRGDRIRPLGGLGRRRVRRVLMEARVPRSERGSYPLVASGDEILWIPGVCRSATAVPVPGEVATRLDASPG